MFPCQSLASAPQGLPSQKYLSPAIAIGEERASCHFEKAVVNCCFRVRIGLIPFVTCAFFDLFEFSHSNAVMKVDNIFS